MSRPRGPLSVDAALATPWTKNMHWVASRPIQLLDAELMALHAYVAPTEGERRMRGAVLRLLERAVGGAIRAGACGGTGLGAFLPDDAIDVSMNSSDLGFQSAPLTALLVELLQVLIRTDMVESAYMVESGIIPLLQIVLTSAYGAFTLLLSVNSTTGIREVEELKRMLTAMGEAKRVRWERLAGVVKMFLDGRGLMDVERGGMDELAVFCLCIVFLQLDQSTGTTSPATDLIKFFRFVCGVDWRKYAVTTHRGGGLLRRASLGWNDDLDFISLQHPVDASRDICSLVSLSSRILVEFSLAASSLSLYSTNSSSADLFRLVREKKSALGGMVSLSVTSQRVRRRRRELWEDGSLHARWDDSAGI